MKRALPQEVFALLNMFQIVFISESCITVLAEEFLNIQHVDQLSASFPVDVGFAAVGASLLFLDPLVNTLATVKLLAVGALPDGRTYNKGADGAFKVF